MNDLLRRLALPVVFGLAFVLPEAATAQLQLTVANEQSGSVPPPGTAPPDSASFTSELADDGSSYALTAKAYAEAADPSAVGTLPVQARASVLWRVTLDVVGTAVGPTFLEASSALVGSLLWDTTLATHRDTASASVDAISIVNGTTLFSHAPTARSHGLFNDRQVLPVSPEPRMIRIGEVHAGDTITLSGRLVASAEAFKMTGSGGPSFAISNFGESFTSSVFLIAAPVPEPSAFAMLMLGCASVLGMSAKRRRP